MARYIDADKLTDSLRESYNRLFELYKKAKNTDAATICEAELNTFMECIIRAETQPTADVEEVRHGVWKRINHGTICTNCYRVFDNDFEFSNKDIRTYFKRCPECGAKMDGGKI